MWTHPTMDLKKIGSDLIRIIQILISHWLVVVTLHLSSSTTIQHRSYLQGRILDLCVLTTICIWQFPMATMATAANAALIPGLGTSSLSPCRASRTKLQLPSGFTGCAKMPGNPLREMRLSAARITCFQRNWLRTDYSVIGFGLIGWIAPSSIPAINGNSLTGLFFDSIGQELAHFPTGPSLTSPFWLWLVTWHIGLFLCLTFGQIGFKGRGEYF